MMKIYPVAGVEESAYILYSCNLCGDVRAKNAVIFAIQHLRERIVVIRILCILIVVPPVCACRHSASCDFAPDRAYTQLQHHALPVLKALLYDRVHTREHLALVLVSKESTI